jgi:hypothetical protein
MISDILSVLWHVEFGLDLPFLTTSARLKMIHAVLISDDIYYYSRVEPIPNK